MTTYPNTDAAATDHLLKNGFDDEGSPLVFDLKKRNLTKAPSHDALTAGKRSMQPAEYRGADWLSSAAFRGALARHEPAERNDWHMRVDEDVHSRKMKRLSTFAYFTDMSSSLNTEGSSDRAERGTKLLATAQSPIERDVLAATIYTYLADIGVNSDARVAWLRDAMGCSQATTYERVRNGQAILRSTVVAAGGELPSARMTAKRPRIDLARATARTRYDSHEWREAINRMPASMRYEFVHHLVQQVVASHLEADKAKDLRLKMIPHRVLNLLDEIGLSARSVREVLATMSEATATQA